MTREDIIAQAIELDPSLNANAPGTGPGAYEGITDKLLAFAIETIALHGFADGEGGSNEDYYGSRVANWVLWTDDQGFKYLLSYRNERRAIEALAAQDRPVE